MSDGELRFVVAVIGGGGFSMMALMGASEGLTAGAAAFAGLTLATVTPGAIRYGFHRRPTGTRPRDTRVPLRALARIAGLTVLSCGCIADGTSYGKFSEPDGDPLERDTVYVERRKGARRQIDRYEKRLIRCYRCGKHRHTYDRDRAKVRVAFEDDPNRYPNDAEIEGGDVPVIPETEVEA